MISGKDNYIKAITFNNPSYLPVLLDVYLDGLYEKDAEKREKIIRLQSKFKDDILYKGMNYYPAVNNVITEGNTKKWFDFWHVGWSDDGHGAITDFHPLEQGYEMLDSYDFPDPDAKGTMTRADKTLLNKNGRYALGYVWFSLFERMWMLRGFNNMLMDPYIEPENFEKLRDKILAFNLRVIDRWLERNIDGIYFSDDWGTQKSLLINPDDWRALYKPAYKEMFEKIRHKGVHVWMHLCGNIIDILPDLIEIGVNVLNPVQPQAMDVKELSDRFGGKITFFGGVDVQGTMIKGTPDQVKAEVHNLVKLFGKFNGGYIGSTSHSIMPETPLDNIIALYQAFSEYV